MTGQLCDLTEGTSPSNKKESAGCDCDCTWCGGSVWGSGARSFGIEPGSVSPAAAAGGERQRTILCSSEVSEETRRPQTGASASCSGSADAMKRAE